MMKKTRIFTVISNEKIATNVHLMKLNGDISDFNAPGQFVNIKLDGKYLRRPISVCCVQDDILTLIYKTVGEGTYAMSQMPAGTKLDILCPLGNGYNINKDFTSPLLIGGGVGVPPMYQLARELVQAGYNPDVILGFNTENEVFFEDEFSDLGCRVTVTTVDGSYGKKGFVTDAFSDIEFDYTFCCGPEPMLKAVYNASKADGQFSFEERMGCGFGSCMGCSCKTKYGNKRICKDGPVLTKEEIIW